MPLTRLHTHPHLQLLLQNSVLLADRLALSSRNWVQNSSGVSSLQSVLSAIHVTPANFTATEEKKHKCSVLLFCTGQRLTTRYDYSSRVLQAVRGWLFLFLKDVWEAERKADQDISSLILQVVEKKYEVRKAHKELKKIQIDSCKASYSDQFMFNTLSVTESSIITTIYCLDVGYCLFGIPLVTHIYTMFLIPSILL